MTKGGSKGWPGRPRRPCESCAPKETGLQGSKVT